MFSGINISGLGGKYDFSNVMARERCVVVNGGGQHVIRSFKAMPQQGFILESPEYSALGGMVLPVFDNLKAGGQACTSFYVNAPQQGGADLRALNSEQPFQPVLVDRCKTVEATH